MIALRGEKLCNVVGVNDWIQYLRCCRYVHYFAGLLSAAIRINNNPLYLHQIILRNLSGLATSTVATAPALRFYVKIYQSMHPVYVSGI